MPRKATPPALPEIMIRHVEIGFAEILSLRIILRQGCSIVTSKRARLAHNFDQDQINATPARLPRNNN
jgi:hypothetical protein